MLRNHATMFVYDGQSTKIMRSDLKFISQSDGDRILDLSGIGVKYVTVCGLPILGLEGKKLK